MHNNSLFIGYLIPFTNISIITVGGTDHKLIHKGKTKIYIKDNDRRIYAINLCDTLLCSSLPINMISIYILGHSFRDSNIFLDQEDTWALNKYKYSVFKLYYNSFTKIIPHSPAHLSEIQINSILILSFFSFIACTSFDSVYIFPNETFLYTKVIKHSFLLKSSLKSDSHLKYIQNGENHNYILEEKTIDPSRKRILR